MGINYDKLFNPNNIEINEDTSEIDSIIEFEEVLFAISESIINYRKEHNLTQKELAKILKVNQTMISKLESGDNNPTFKSIYNISRRLNNSSNIFIEILDNIKTKLQHLSIGNYEVKIQSKRIITQKYSINITENSNIIEMNYNNNEGGNISYEKYTSSISDAG